jgi:3-isopropylmalate/(R)-2-methylmalate dehydratase large subunit
MDFVRDVLPSARHRRFHLPHPGKRVLFLTKDPDLIRRQLRGELDLRMEDLRVEELMDDINPGATTPGWSCFD